MAQAVDQEEVTIAEQAIRRHLKWEAEQGEARAVSFARAELNRLGKFLAAGGQLVREEDHGMVIWHARSRAERPWPDAMVQGLVEGQTFTRKREEFVVTAHIDGVTVTARKR